MKQNNATACNQFDPFSYFGALDMPFINSEEIPAHPRIEKIFKSPEQLEREKMLHKKSDGSGGKCQNYSNSLTFTTAAKPLMPAQ